MIGRRLLATPIVTVALASGLVAIGASCSATKYTPLEIGECLPSDAGVEGQRADTPPVVPCGEVHRYQVFARDDLEPPDDRWPGQELLDANARRLCGLAIPDATGRQIEELPSDTKMVYVAPSEDSWADGDREVECLFRTDEDTTVTLVPADT